MALVDETVVNTSAYQWMLDATIHNPISGAASIYFTEQTVIDLNGTPTPVGDKKDSMKILGDMAETFPLVDPATNLPTGQVKSAAEFYADVYSLWMHTRAQNAI